MKYTHITTLKMAKISCKDNIFRHTSECKCHNIPICYDTCINTQVKAWKSYT